LVLEPRSFWHLFVLVYIEIYVFRGNPYQAHSLQQSYHQKYNCKNKIKLIYLTFIHCTCKLEKHKKFFLSANYEQTLPDKKHKESNAHEQHKESNAHEQHKESNAHKQHKESNAHEQHEGSNAHEQHKESNAHEQHKESNAHEQHKESNAHEQHKQPFLSENFNRTRHAHAYAMSADSIPPRSLQHPDFIDKNCSL